MLLQHAGREAQARARQQAGVAQLGQRALAGLDLEALVREAVAFVVETLDIEYATLLELLPDEDALLVRAGVGWAEGVVGVMKVPAGRESLAGYTLVRDCPVIVEDLRAESRFVVPAALLAHGVLSTLSVVVRGGERPFGVLGAHSRGRRRFSDDDANFLQAVANVVGAAVERGRAEEALKESEERHRVLLEAIPDLIFLLTRDGIYLDYQALSPSDLLLPPSEFVGRSMYEVLPAELADQTMAAAERTLATGRVEVFEYQLELHGTLRHYEARIAAGGEDRFLAVIRDITERRHAEEERARLLASEREAHAAVARAAVRTASLQAVTAGLARAVTPGEVASVIVEQGVGAIEARAGSVALLVEDGGELEFVAMAGYPDEIVAVFQRRRLDRPSPLVDAFLSGEPVILESREAISERYPNLVDAQARIGDAAWVCVPLLVEGDALGAIGFSFAEPREFSDEDRAFLVSLAQQCAQALDRAGLYERLRESSAKLTSERDRLERLLERLQEGVVAIDRDLQVEFANAEAERLLDGRLFEGDVLPDPWGEFSLPGFASGLLGHGAGVAVERVSPSEERTYELVGIPARDSDTAVLVVRDVSRRERQERAEREFVTNAAHELRTPIAAIAAAIEALQLGAKEIAEERELFLADIEREAERLGRLVRALLLLARAQAGQEELLLEPVELGPLLAEIASGLHPGEGVEVSVACQDGLAVLAERDLLERALANLAANAATHTARGRVVLSARRAANGSAEIEIADTGSGLSSEERERIVDRFYRGGQRDGEGFGLGLAIVRETVRALGGGLDIESSPGAGTTARLTLPLAGVG